MACLCFSVIHTATCCSCLALLIRGRRSSRLMANFPANLTKAALHLFLSSWCWWRVMKYFVWNKCLRLRRKLGHRLKVYPLRVLQLYFRKFHDDASLFIGGQGQKVSLHYEMQRATCFSLSRSALAVVVYHLQIEVPRSYPGLILISANVNPTVDIWWCQIIQSFNNNPTL